MLRIETWLKIPCSMPVQTNSLTARVSFDFDSVSETKFSGMAFAVSGLPKSQ
jgi:hypothetical protein